MANISIDRYIRNLANGEGERGSTRFTCGHDFVPIAFVGLQHQFKLPAGLFFASSYFYVTFKIPWDLAIFCEQNADELLLWKRICFV